MYIFIISSAYLHKCSFSILSLYLFQMYFKNVCNLMTIVCISKNLCSIQMPHATFNIKTSYFIFIIFIRLFFYPFLWLVSPAFGRLGQVYFMHAFLGT